MNNETVAYRHWMIDEEFPEDSCWEYFDAPTGEDCVDCEPLYTRPFIEGWKCSAPPCKCDITNFKVCCYSSYTHPAKTLTDEEINKLWAESHEDGIAMQQGFTTQQHYFAHLILRKAQE